MVVIKARIIMISYCYYNYSKEDGAHLDVVAGGFWNNRQCAYFDKRVFNSNAPS